MFLPRNLLLLTTLLVAAPLSAAPPIVKCTQEDGSVTYTRGSCPDDAEMEKTDIKSEPADPEQVRAAEEKRKALLLQMEERDKQRELSSEAAAEERSLRKQQCEQARRNQQKLAVARRVTEGEGDNKHYLSDSEVAERKRLNEERLKEFCGN